MEEGRRVGSVGEVVPVKVWGVVIAGQDQILLLGLVEVMVVAPIEMDHGRNGREGGRGRGGGWGDEVGVERGKSGEMRRKGGGLIF